MNVSPARLRADVQSLVRIPSAAEVDTIAAHALELLRRAGVPDAHRDKDGNVIGALGRGPGLLLNAHLDTVGVQGFDGDPYAARAKGNRLIGRGVSDCKAGVAAALEIARCLAGRPLRRRVIFALTVWEEGSGPGPNGAFGAARRADAAGAIVLESTVRSAARMDVHAGCRGILRADLLVRGRSGHSSRPDLADNALYRALDFARLFREHFTPHTLPAAEFNILGHPLRAQCVATLTEIEALQGRNVIPGRCVLGMDCRLNPGQDHRPVLRRIETLAREFGRGMIRLHDIRVIPGHLCRDETLLQACRSAAAANGFRAAIGLLDGRADSAIFQNTGGIPSVIFGPGVAEQAHTPDESLVLPWFYRSAQACLDAVLHLAGEAPCPRPAPPRRRPVRKSS